MNIRSLHQHICTGLGAARGATLVECSMTSSTLIRAGAKEDVRTLSASSEVSAHAADVLDRSKSQSTRARGVA